MSYVPDRIKLAAKSSNYAGVARFSSTLDDAYVLFIANNCNNYFYNDVNNASVIGAQSSNSDNGINYETYIAAKKNDIISKIARFNSEAINLDTNTIVRGNIVPSDNIIYDLGTDQNRWRELYLSGNSIYLNNSVISTENETVKFTNTNQSNIRIAAGELKLQSEGSDSNVILSTTNDGLFVTIHDDANNVVKIINISDKSTNSLEEGSNNLFWTSERFDVRLATKTLDYIADGTSNKFIVNDVYASDLQIEGTLRASNLIIIGDTTTITTTTYQTENLEIISDASDGPALRITQNGTQNVIEAIDSNNNVAMLITSDGTIGINTSTPSSDYVIDINGSLRATDITGVGSNIIDVNLDNVVNGIHNQYIIDNIYDDNLTVIGDLIITCNLFVYGTQTVLNTATYQSEKLEIVSSGVGPALYVKQIGSDDIMKVYDDNNIVINVVNGGKVGINKESVDYSLDVAGIVNADLFQGSGSNLYDINLNDRTTSLLKEGSNLYYTAERVGIIVSSSNVETSNYINNTSNELANTLQTTSNIISTHVTNTDIYMSNYVDNTSNELGNTILETSNIISTHVTNTDIYMSNYVDNTSNELANTLQHTSNIISQCITNTDIYMSNYIDNTSNELANTLQHTSNIISEFITGLSGLNISDISISNYINNTSNELGNTILETSNIISTRLTNISIWNQTIDGIYYDIPNNSVGIGTSVYNAYKLNVNGNTFITGTLYVTNNVIAAVSDERLKTVTSKIDNALDIINSLQAFKYQLNDIAGSFGFETSNIHIGLSAQQVQKVLPEIVTNAPFDNNINNEYLTIQYDRMIPVLVEAIKQLSKKNDELASQINILRSSNI